MFIICVIYQIHTRLLVWCVGTQLGYPYSGRNRASPIHPAYHVMCPTDLAKVISHITVTGRSSSKKMGQPQSWKILLHQIQIAICTVISFMSKTDPLVPIFSVTKPRHLYSQQPDTLSKSYFVEGLCKKLQNIKALIVFMVRTKI